MPWAKAIELCGGEDRMLLGVTKQQKWNWEFRDGKTVPAEHVLRIYEERVKAAGVELPVDPLDGLPSKARQIVTYVRWLWDKADHDEKFRKRERVILEALAEPPWERTPSSGVTPLRNSPRGRPAAGASQAVGG